PKTTRKFTSKTPKDPKTIQIQENLKSISKNQKTRRPQEISPKIIERKLPEKLEDQERLQKILQEIVERPKNKENLITRDQRRSQEISPEIDERPEDRKLISKIQKNRKNPTTQLKLPESRKTRGDHKKFHKKIAEKPEDKEN
ncbi:24453_t:CDS:2, partial [Cetraspora pellucida]